MVAIGFTLQPDYSYLGLLEPIFDSAVDYLEIAPETTWWPHGTGQLGPNGFHGHFLDIVERTGVFTVAHGVGFSLGDAGDDSARQDIWLDRLRADHADFSYRWYSDHLGATSLAGQWMNLPMPVPMTDTSVALITERLHAMQTVVADVAVENSAFYFLWGDPLAEADLLARVVAAPGCHLLLDLHNLYTLSVNFAVSPEDYLARLPLDKVIEIHISGGSTSLPGWLDGGAVMRLDSHDHAVPEPVWQLLAKTVPRCSNLRGVTLERMEGTVTAADVPLLVGELARVRTIVEEFAPNAADHATPDQDPARPAQSPLSVPDDRQAHARFTEKVAQAMIARDPVRAIRDIASTCELPDELRHAAAGASASGVELTALLVARLRFERLTQASEQAAQWFAEDPEGFAAGFRAYHHSVPPTAVFPVEEARLFAAWLARNNPASLSD